MNSGFNVQKVVLLRAGRGQHWLHGRKEENSKGKIKSKEENGGRKESNRRKN
jgi:hypothetical protein